MKTFIATVLATASIAVSSATLYSTRVEALNFENRATGYCLNVNKTNGTYLNSPIRQFHCVRGDGEQNMQVGLLPLISLPSLGKLCLNTVNGSDGQQYFAHTCIIADPGQRLIKSDLGNGYFRLLSSPTSPLCVTALVPQLDLITTKRHIQEFTSLLATLAINISNGNHIRQL